MKELQACRYDVFSLVITELYSHLPMDLVFNNLQNLMSLQLTYGAKHMGMEYERPHIGMKMSDAQFLQDCLKTTNNFTCYQCAQKCDICPVCRKGFD